MQQRYYYTILLLLMSSLLAMSSSRLGAQEIQAKLTINTQQVSSVDPQMIQSLESSVNALLNEQKWTEANFAKTERVDCIVTITIAEMPTINTFRGDIQVTARRPVYNSNYLSPLLNFKDTQLDFSYTLGESLDFNMYNMSNNMVATIAYYCYLVIGLDFDSFSLHGGRAYFDKAMEISNIMQASQSKGGWQPFSGKVNRYDLAVALTDDVSAIFHSVWYNYHRQGLDMMESNTSRGRLKIIETIAELEKLYDTRPSSPLFTLFGDTKIDELVKVCSEATEEEKKEIKKKLQRLFPSKGSIINELK